MSLNRYSRVPRLSLYATLVGLALALGSYFDTQIPAAAEMAVEPVATQPTMALGWGIGELLDSEFVSVAAGGFGAGALGVVGQSIGTARAGVWWGVRVGAATGGIIGAGVGAMVGGL